MRKKTLERIQIKKIVNKGNKSRTVPHFFSKCDILSLGIWLRMQDPDPNCLGNVGSGSVHYTLWI
jgi:hypothetical protein